MTTRDRNYHQNGLLSKVSHEIASITSNWMTPVRSPGVKVTAYATAPNSDPCSESHPNVELSSLLNSFTFWLQPTKCLLRSPASYLQLSLLKLWEICKNLVLMLCIFYLVSAWWYKLDGTSSLCYAKALQSVTVSRTTMETWK